MKTLSSGGNQILNFLLDRNDYVPVKEIAKHMHFSEKTSFFCRERLDIFILDLDDLHLYAKLMKRFMTFVMN